MCVENWIYIMTVLGRTQVDGEKALQTKQKIFVYNMQWWWCGDLSEEDLSQLQVSVTFPIK